MQVIKGGLEGTFYLDDIRVVATSPTASGTAVLEERTSGQPETFTLSQNFPNPFNSGTVIRFALPQHEDIELVVYNLAGQQVATLADGVRQAGNYSIHWDGRDNAGRELASGMYLYQLQVKAEKQVKTRKLLLLR